MVNEVTMVQRDRLKTISQRTQRNLLWNFDHFSWTSTRTIFFVLKLLYSKAGVLVLKGTAYESYHTRFPWV